MTESIKILAEWLLHIAEMTERADLDNLYMLPRLRRLFCGDIYLDERTQYEKYTCLITFRRSLRDEIGKEFGPWWVKYKDAIPSFEYPAGYNHVREPPPRPVHQNRNGHAAYLYDFDEDGNIIGDVAPLVRIRTHHPGEPIPEGPRGHWLYPDDWPPFPIAAPEQNHGNGLDGVDEQDVQDALRDGPQQNLEDPEINPNLFVQEDNNLDVEQLDHTPDDISASEYSSALPPLDPEVVIPTYRSEHEDHELFFPVEELQNFEQNFLAQKELDDFLEHYPLLTIHVHAHMLHSFDLKLLLGYITAKYPRKPVRISLNSPAYGMFFPEYFTQLLGDGIILGFDFPEIPKTFEQLDLTTIANRNTNGETTYYFPELLEVTQTVSLIDLSNTGTNRIMAPSLKKLSLNLTNSCKNWQLINMLKLFYAPDLEELFIYSLNEYYEYESAKYEIDIVKVLKLFPKLRSLRIQSLLVNILFERERHFSSQLEVLTICNYAADLDFEDWSLKKLKFLHLQKINSKLTNLGKFLGRCRHLQDLRIIECGFIPLLQNIYMKRIKRLTLKYYGTETPIFLLTNLKCPNLIDLELTILRTNLSLNKFHAPNLNRLIYNCQHAKKYIDGKLREPVNVNNEIHCPKLKWLSYTLGSSEEYADLVRSPIIKNIKDFFPRYYGDEYIEKDELFNWRLMLEEHVHPAKYHHFDVFQLTHRY